MQKIFLNKTWPIVKSSKTVRTLLALIVIFVILIFTSAMFRMSYNKKITANQAEVEKNITTLTTFQQLVSGDTTVHSASDLFEKKSFANFDEVIPFIAFLENLFFEIDPKAEITVKSRENQIFMDHFADYQISLKPNEEKEALYKALDELEDSRFITNILQFNLDYKPMGEGHLNQLKQVQFNIRLFLK